MKYYTKCGLEFDKSVSAETTGYHIAEDNDEIIDSKCKACPFVIDVQEGWPLKVHKRYECRAGCKKPNHENTYSGYANDKCTLRVYSLDHDFCESVLAFAQNHPDLSASYNQDRSDCRLTVSISCSQNQKGMAAKQELIDKFFNAKKAEKIKSKCPFLSSVGMDYIDCGTSDGKLLYKNQCDNVSDCKNKTNTLCFDRYLDCKKYRELYADPTAIKPELKVCIRCSNNSWHSGLSKNQNGQEWCFCQMKQTAMKHNDSCEWFNRHPDWKFEEKKQEEDKVSNCVDCAKFSGTDASNFHCGGLAFYQDKYGLPKPTAPICKEFSPKVADTVITEPDQEAQEVDTIKAGLRSLITESEKQDTVELLKFDYTGLDDKTRDTLLTAEKEIAQIKMQTVYDIGNYLSIAHEALAKAGSGSFGAWCESIGFSRQSAQNYIQAYTFICQNFDRPEKAIGIQPSLLFAASKPSAPPELAKAVVDGDITQHKDYIDALNKLKEAEGNAEAWRKALDGQKAVSKDAKKLFVEENEKRQELEEKVKNLNQQILQLKQNTESGKLKELGSLIKDKQNLLTQKEHEIAELKIQLNEKPVEASAAEIREVIPSALGKTWCDNITNAVELISKLTDNDIDLLIRIAGKDNYHYLKDDIRTSAIEAAEKLKSLSETIYKLPAPAAEFMKQYAI